MKRSLKKVNQKPRVSEFRIKTNPARDLVSDLINRIERHLKLSEYGEIIRDGLVVALVGQPNVGKSSLLNILSKPRQD